MPGHAWPGRTGRRGHPLPADVTAPASSGLPRCSWPPIGWCGHVDAGGRMNGAGVLRVWRTQAEEAWDPEGSSYGVHKFNGRVDGRLLTCGADSS